MTTNYISAFENLHRETKVIIIVRLF